MLDGSIRCEHLTLLLSWYVGVTRGWNASVGAHGRWLERSLDGETWSAYLATYADSSSAASWQAMFAAADLAARVGRLLARQLGYGYPDEVDRRVRAYLRSLAPDGR